MDDDFFDNDNKNEPVFQDESHQDNQGHQQQHQQQDGQYDDFFGGDNSQQAHQQQQQTPQHQQDQDDFFNGGQQQQQVAQSNYAQFDQQEYSNKNQYSSSLPQQDMFDASEATPQQISEHEERRLKLQKEEQERTQQLIKKQSEENTLKSQRISAAKSYLSNWKSERETNIQKRKKACLQEEEVLVESRQKVTYKNSWDKVTQNISLKAGEYPGSKDVTRMKESILNKKTDLQNN